MRACNLVAGFLVLSLSACAGASGRGPAIGSSSSSKVADVGGTDFRLRPYLRGLGAARRSAGHGHRGDHWCQVPNPPRPATVATP